MQQLWWADITSMPAPGMSVMQPARTYAMPYDKQLPWHTTSQVFAVSPVRSWLV
jgi:hypothetical protein